MPKYPDVPVQPFTCTMVASTEAGAASGTPMPILGISPEELTTWFAHEMKSPLAAALQSARLATYGLRDPEQCVCVQRCLAVISRQLTRMDELVRSFLDAAQLRKGKLSLNLEMGCVAEIVRSSIEGWREICPDHDIVLDAPAQAVARVDRERLREVVDNLISNAIKYGGEARHVAVSVATAGCTVRIVVTDRGNGVAASELTRIFHPFHRAAGQRGKGHGLGLYIAAALTRLHGGSIEATSKLGEGSHFTVTLPSGGPSTPVDASQRSPGGG